MNSEKEPRRRSLYQMEAQIMGEGREWMRQRLQEEMQKEADRDGLIFPPQRTKDAPSAPAKNPPAHRRRRR